MNQTAPLTILQLVPESLPSFRADVAVLFGKYLPRHAVYCDIVGKSAAGPVPEQGFASVRRASARGGRLLRETGFLLLCLRALLGADKRDCAAIQVRDMVSIGLMAMLVARLRGIPFVYWMSFLMCEGRIGRARAALAQRSGLRNRLVLWKGLLEQWLLYRFVLPGAAHVFVQSEMMLERMRGHGIRVENMTAVPMGVDMELIAAGAPAARRPAGWEGVPLLAYLGTLDGARQLECLVDALALLRARVPDACLLLIGDSGESPGAPALRHYIAGVGLADAVRITGWLPSQQAWQLLAGADAAVSYIPRGALYDVSSPTKLLEYLALGMPAVGNDTPDQVRVLTDSGAGWLVASDAAALAAAAAAVLADPAAARRRAAAGPAYIERARSYRVLAELVAGQYRRLARR